MRHLYTVLCATIVLATAAPRPASSCRCARPTIRRTILPRHGSTAVPTSATLRVFITGGVPHALRWALANEYRLRDARGKRVAVTPRVVGLRLDLTPGAPLLPGTRYVLEQVFAFDASGRRLTDNERWRLARGRRRASARRHRIRRAWFPVAAFHTADRPGASKPGGAPAINKLRVVMGHGGGDCGPGASMHVDYALPAGVRESDIIELEVRGKGILASIPAPVFPARQHTLNVGNMLCRPDKIDVGFARGYAARLRVRTISGSVGTAGPWKRTTARTRCGGRRPRPTRGHRQPVDNDAVKRWLSGPVVKVATAGVARGPTACPNGLRTLERMQVASKGAASSYQALGSLTWERGRGSSLVWRKGHSALVTFAAGKKPRQVPLPGSGYGAQLIRRGDAIYVASVHAPRSRGKKRVPPTIVVTRHTPSGKARWRRVLSGPGGVNNTKPRVALGDSGLFVLWEHWPTYGNDNNLQWALLAPATGKVTFRRQGVGPGVPSDSHPGLAALGQGYHVIYSPSRGPMGMAPGPRLLSIDGRGKVAFRTPRLKFAGPGFDMVAHGERLAVACSSRRGPSRGQIRWFLMAPSASIVAGPVVVSQGMGSRNRKPRITWDARTGLSAVAWEVHPARTLHAVVVDDNGVVSPRTQLSRGLRVSTVALAPTAGGVVASFAVDYAPLRAEWLGCSARPRMGPPASIGALEGT